MVAAKKRGDEEMISKLSGYEDLFAYDAKYHKTCYSQYISQRNIKYSFKINESINAKKMLTPMMITWKFLVLA